jgi:hypothetical protein
MPVHAGGESSIILRKFLEPNYVEDDCENDEDPDDDQSEDLHTTGHETRRRLGAGYHCSGLNHLRGMLIDTCGNQMSLLRKHE